VSRCEEVVADKNELLPQAESSGSSDDGIPSDVESGENNTFPLATVNPFLLPAKCTPLVPEEFSSAAEDEAKKNPDQRLVDALAQWALKFNIKHSALSSLLKTLRDHGHPALPKCSKTVLHTPRSTVDEIQDLCGGTFWYFGILNGMKKRLSPSFLNKTKDGIIEMDGATDGLSLSPFHSNGVQIWPIMGCLKNQKTPFLIALWCGNHEKPTDVDTFWEDYIHEAEYLMEGFQLTGIDYKLKVRKYKGNAPARGWFKQTNPHTCKISCER